MHSEFHIEKNEFFMTYKQSRIDPSKTLKEAGMVEDCDLYVQVEKYMP